MRGFLLGKIVANRFFNPDTQFADSTGAALSGAKLFFYTTGTSTKLNTYSDSGLTVANTNPVVLDSNGRAGAIFLQNAKYKVVLAPSTDTDPPTSPIWTQDPVYTSDYSAAAKVTGSNGNPNGVLAGTAASATLPADLAWDYANNILYACTTTGTSSSAVWTAINATTAAAVVPSPQGRLTPSTGVPVIGSDVIAATAVYYTPYTGLLVPIYNGTSFIPTSIVSELSATLVSSHVANNIYDFYVFLVNGVATLGTGPTWSAGTGGSVTAGSSVRGTGAGGAALSLLNGIYTNAVSMTIRYGDGTTTATVGANKATYVGSMFVDGTNGQVTCHVSYGQSRKFGIWNAYNRKPINLICGDSTSSWTYALATVRPANNNTANSLTIFCGLGEETADVIYQSYLGDVSASSAQMTAAIGVGLNSTTTFSGTQGKISNSNASSAISSTYTGFFRLAPVFGINTITALESSATTTTVTFNGTENSMRLSAEWNG